VIGRTGSRRLCRWEVVIEVLGFMLSECVNDANRTLATAYVDVPGMVDSAKWDDTHEPIG
jgi:hypothetical protein